MDWTIEIPLCAIIIFAVSVVGNVILAVYCWLVRKSERQNKESIRALQYQVKEFEKISRRLSEIASQEQQRCIRILDKVLTEREKEEWDCTTKSRSGTLA